MYLKIKGIYKYIFIIYIFIFFVKGNILALPAFPGASGYGANTRGAYSGSSSPKILKVDSASSFKSAISYDKPRIIIFTRGGTYDLGWSDDRIYNPYVTIAGQTAPGDGVCLKNGALRVDAHSVIIRGLRWRTGLPRSTGSNRDCIGIEGKDLNDIIIDHNSLSWASDEIAVSWNEEDRITWSWNIISEGIGTHGYGLLAGTYVKNSSIHHNLFAHLVMRMPECNNGTNGEIINNVMYHWEGKATDFITGTQYWDVKKNYYKQKADQSDQKSIKIYWPGYEQYIINTNSRFFIEGNVGPGRPVSTTGGEWDMVYMEDGGGSGAQYTGPLKANASVLSTPPVVRVAEHTAEEAYKAVLEKVGASAPMHDDVDRRVINDVKNGTGTRPDSVSDSSYPSLAAGSYPTDSDDDGMPDTWEIERGLNPNYKKDAHSDRDGDGYKNIEEYINGCFPRTAVVTASPVSIKSNGTDSSTIRVEIRNECDVVDKPYDRQITFAIANGIGKFSNGQTSYTTSAVKGVATASFTSNTVGTSSITVTPAGINSQIVTVKVYSYSIEITANPTTFEGNGTNKSTIVATIKDASGNIYNTNDQVNFTVSGPGRLPGGAMVLNVNAVNGRATTEITSNGGAGTIVVTASYSSALPVSVNIIATPSANSPIGEWRFEEGTGTTAADTSGGNNNGILVNSPTWLNGKVGKALQFDGLNTYVTISDSNVLDLTTGISIEAWVKTDVITTDGGPTRRVLDKGVYVLAASDQAYFKVVIGGANKGVGKAWTSADVNSWHHLIGTYDGATVKLYQDGTLAGQTSATGNIDVNGNPLIIGRQGTSPAGRFDGVIDEVKIYNRALSASEVLEHYQGMVPPPVDNPPQVALVVPNNNSVVSGIVAIEGTATDDNGIGKVCFYIDDVIKSTDTTAPYTYSLDTTQYANGTHTIKLIATDTIGQTANAQINISVDNAVVDIPPTIIITSLGDGDTISDIITIEAAANDDNGINSVAFYIDNELRSTDTTSPYTYVLDTTQLTNGSHIIKVIASDTLSQTAITQITVLIDNTTLDNPPTINIVTPNNNSVISGIVTISGTANDDNGISSVGFYIDNVIKSTDTTAPYAYSLDTTEYANGTHTIKLIATDTNSQTATTQITITIDNIVIDNPPQVTITSPTNNSVISGIITINATATDDNGIGKVCFYMNNVLKSTDTTSPYAYNLDTTQYTNGTHIIKAIATDTIAQTAIVQITVTIDNAVPPPVDNPPQVALVVPNNNSVVSEVVAIEGTATDDNGITKVCFYIDNVIKSTDTTTPYTYNLDTTQYTNGTHIIKIVATDTANQTATTQRTITVNNIVVDNPPTINITAPANNSVVSEVVAIEGTATDAEGGISKVCFYIDNVIKSTDTTAPYAYTLDTTQYTNGTHIIKAVATDTIAQTASTQITVTINNIGISLVPKVDYLSITKLERAELQLSWLAPIDANEITAYNIYMSTGEMDYTTVYKTVASTQTQVIISGLIANQEYKFVLRSVDTNGNEEKNTYIIADTAVEHVINGMGVVKVPQNGMDISGKKITLISESIDGDISNIKDITFEYRRSGDDNWITISVANPNHPNPDNTYPYFINWDVSELNSSYLYNVRAVATDKNGIRDTRTGYVTVGLDNEDPDIEETSNYKRERIDNRRQNEIIMGEPNIDQICKVNVPDGVLSSSSTMIKIVINPMVSQTIGKSLELANGGNLILIGYIHNIYLESGQDKFSKEIEISLPYQDDNKDNRVDGTNIGSNRLIICSFDELIGKWQKANGSTVDKVKKLVTCKTNHLSYYGVFAVLQSDLNTAHIYPNPYKPSIGHTSIIFTNLTNRTKAQIFNLAGDVVYEQEKDTPTGELIWDVKNAEGEPIASGVYMYMITNNAGQVKKGKLAIIR